MTLKLHTIWTRLKVKKGKEHIPYFISIEGKLISSDYKDSLGRKRLGRTYKPKIDFKGYHRISVNKQTYITPSIHRNVALCFIPNPDNKPEINHINGDKIDNRIENLEWVTTLENIRHAIKEGLREPFLKSSQELGTAATIKKYGKIPSPRNTK